MRIAAIKFVPQFMTNYFSLPRYNFLGVMSTIGGSLGLYLGFSLLDSYRVIASLVHVLANWRNFMKIGRVSWDGGKPKAQEIRI